MVDDGASVVLVEVVGAEVRESGSTRSVTRRYPTTATTATNQPAKRPRLRR